MLILLGTKKEGWFKTTLLLLNNRLCTNVSYRINVNDLQSNKQQAASVLIHRIIHLQTYMHPHHHHHLSFAEPENTQVFELNF